MLTETNELLLAEGYLGLRRDQRILAAIATNYGIKLFKKTRDKQTGLVAFNALHCILLQPQQVGRRDIWHVLVDNNMCVLTGAKYMQAVHALLHSSPISVQIVTTSYNNKNAH